MQFITLTSDMGNRDHYVASLKVALLQQIATHVHVVDITHQVAPFDVVEAAFHVGQAFRSFPSGTIHVIGVDAEPSVIGSPQDAYPSIMVLSQQYFVANDNGFFSALTQYSEEIPRFYRIHPDLWQEKDSIFATKNILVPIACQLAKKVSIEELAHKQASYQNAFYPIPTIEDACIKGVIVHFDSFGNAITNIHRTLFERIGQNMSFTIQLRKGDSYIITKISTAYNKVMEGEKLALFNENEWLEIAINKGANNTTGGVQTLFGLSIFDTVTIHFFPHGQSTLSPPIFT